MTNRCFFFYIKTTIHTRQRMVKTRLGAHKELTNQAIFVSVGVVGNSVSELVSVTL